VQDTPDIAGPGAPAHRLERRVVLLGWLLVLLFMGAIVVVNVLTQSAEASRTGRAIDKGEAWILEITSVLVLLALVPLVGVVEQRFPFTPSRWGVFLAAHLAASVAYSALHIAGMTALRSLALPFLFGRAYQMWPDPVAELTYEYSKDLLSYAVTVLLLALARHLLDAWRADRARQHGARTGRLTLKSGGSTMVLDGQDFRWAESAANYVEINAAGRPLLVRMTLKQLERQLAEVGVAVVQVHRSRLINAERVAALITGRDGDFELRLDDGTVLRGSRRYRAETEQSLR
jgi:DNA-binding LytR/AlgR family response regulator